MQTQAIVLDYIIVVALCFAALASGILVARISLRP